MLRMRCSTVGSKEHAIISRVCRTPRLCDALPGPTRPFTHLNLNTCRTQLTDRKDIATARRWYRSTLANKVHPRPAAPSEDEDDPDTIIRSPADLSSSYSDHIQRTSNTHFQHGNTPGASGKSWALISAEYNAQSAIQRYQIQQILKHLPHNNIHLKDVILISIDFEWNTRSRFYGDPTKFGLAILDTRHLPSEQMLSAHRDALQSPWTKYMDVLHFAMIDRSDFGIARLESRDAIDRWARLCRFGSNTWIKAADIVPILERLFRNPNLARDAADFSKPIDLCERNIVLIGHGILSDMMAMQRRKFDPRSVAKIVATFDTSKSTLTTLPVKLDSLLGCLGLRGPNGQRPTLHVAGNDAMWALTAFLLSAELQFRQPQRWTSAMASLRKGENYHERTVTVKYQPAKWKLGGTATEKDFEEVIAKTKTRQT